MPPTIAICDAKNRSYLDIWYTVNSLKQKTPSRFFEYLSIDQSSMRKCNKKLKFLWPFLGIFFLANPPFQLWSTLTANIQQMWISAQVKLYQVIASHIDSLHIKYEYSMPGTYGNIDHWILENCDTNWIWRHLRHLIQLNLTGHTIIII